MCGIAGRFHPDSLPLDAAWHVQADAQLAHRGPDGAGLYRDAYCELVHRRLALLDLSPTGAQPLANEDGSVLVIFNGEIYNHRVLRAELINRGHTLRGTSDTEVLVHLYEEHGAAMIERLRGMFAFAIYDGRRRQLLLARDRFGIKPLYYAHLGNQFVFASEIKALLTLADFRPRIDRQACYDYLGLGYVPEPATAFAEIKALPRGATLLINRTGAHLEQHYATRAQPDATLDQHEVVADVAERLRQAVGQQLVADVPVAACLSGGIDSSLVVAAACSSGHSAPQTFNVQFPDASYDETAVARTVAAHCGTTHQTIDLRDWSAPPELFQSLLEHFDQPFADTSLLPMYLVAQAIRERGIICALSGDGGDEAFGGYGRFWRAERLLGLMRWPRWLQIAAIQTSDKLATRTRDVGRQAAKAMRLAQAGRGDSSVLIAGLSNYLNEEQKTELLWPDVARELMPVYRHFDGYEPSGTDSIEELSRRMTENLFAVGLPSDMLRKVDMMSMRAGIEVRVPLLDEEIVALGLRLPHRLKTDGRQGKLMLRRLAEQSQTRLRHPTRPPRR
jgi:asparagine synthase (glutamine-hydrolysing)